MNTSLTEFESQSHRIYSQREIPEVQDREDKKELHAIPLTDPIERLAICMSGGGFRATAFCLGTLSFLNKVSYRKQTLLERVCLISSASGGSVTALTYALAKSKGTPFQSYFDSLKQTVQGEDVILDALKILNDLSFWKGSKQRNLINAFALTYDKKLFSGATFESITSIKSKLRICINTTEFFRGLTFRFQNFGFIGNKFLNLKKSETQITNKIKVADILAASSCFPVGFEPIEFPRDYVHSNLTKKELDDVTSIVDYQNKPVLSETIPLMDGGITDNQGIYSGILADLNAREDGRPPISLFIVADVASYFMDDYDPPKQKNGILRLFNLQVFYITSVVLAGLGIWTSLRWLEPDVAGWKKYVGAALFFPSAFVIAWFISDVLKYLVTKIFYNKRSGFGLIKSLFQIKNFSTEVLTTLSRYLSRVRISVLEQMIKNRISSTATMVLDVNLKQVRRLINDIFYSNALFEDRRCTSYIYEYSKQNNVSKVSRIKEKHWSTADKDLMMPSESLQQIAEEARTMGTTLWFDKKDQKAQKLEKLILCGEFTTCGSLLEYILDLQSNKKAWALLSEETQNDLTALSKGLKTQWDAYQKLIIPKS